MNQKPLLSSPIAEMLGVDKKNQAAFTDKALAHLHEYYITGTIEEANKYTEWFNQIRHAPPTDIIKLYINSEGGSLWTAIQFMRVIRECKAPVVASVEGACMSAATIIFLMSDTYEISPHSMFMFHNYSGGTIGKGGEMIDQIKHERVWSEKLLFEIYQNFLTDAEIRAILENKDIWMTAEEVVSRLNKKAKILAKKKIKSTKGLDTN
jgi:ATP-dependent protease ClpP protease subunit